MTTTARQRLGALIPTVVGALLYCVSDVPVRAQSLDDQYEFFLATQSRRCQNMNFEVDDQLVLIPGQAGPNLGQFCSGPPLVTGPGSSTSSTGGGAGAAAGRGQGSAEDAALRRRREQLRNEEADERPGAVDVQILESSNAGLFLSLDYQRQEQDVTRYEAGRRSDMFGATFGSDYRFGTTAVAGVALKYTDLSGDFDANGGDFQTHGRGMWIYGSWMPRPRMFVDMSVGLEARDMDTRRIVGRRIVNVFLNGGSSTSFNPPLTQVEGSTDSRESGADLRVGYDAERGSLTIGPRASLSARRASMNGFAEDGATPMTLIFDKQVEKSLRSSLGLQGSKAFNVASGAIVTQLNLDWLHEFQDDQRFITARFAEDLRANPVQLRFLNQAPDRDWYNARASAVAVFAHGFSAFFAIESTFGHDYLQQSGASLGVRLEF